MAFPSVDDITTTIRNAFAPASIPEAPVYLTGCSQKECPLFALPAELRTRIYTFALTQHHNSNAYLADEPTDMVNIDQVEQARPSKELLLTCRRIYSEAQGIYLRAQRNFWKHNTFCVELRKDWSEDNTTEEPTLHFSAILRCQMNAIQNLVVFVETGTKQHVYCFKAGASPGSIVPDLENTTADRLDRIALATTLHSDQIKQQAKLQKLNSTIDSIEKYNHQAASFLINATKDRVMTAQEEHFATALMGKLKPWVQHTAMRFDLILNPKRALLEVLLKVMHKKYKVKRNPQLFLEN